MVCMNRTLLVQSAWVSLHAAYNLSPLIYSPAELIFQLREEDKIQQEIAAVRRGLSNLWMRPNNTERNPPW